MNDRSQARSLSWEAASRYPGAFASDVLHGLSQRRKRLPCKYLYDRRGAELFERICELPEYYPTRTELAIMRKYAREMAAAIGPHVVLIEPGSGSAVKTRVLLDHLREPAAYVPIDISREQLVVVAGAIAAEYPRIEVAPLSGDFTEPLAVPASIDASLRRVVYFPGSTIGNFEPHEAKALLANIRRLAGPGGGLLIGVDLKKDPAVLHAAYNDSAGVTAEFNLNLLHRVGRELGGTFDAGGFAHYAFYEPGAGRIEMHLVSRDRQIVHAAGERFTFEAGESIHTESSYKYHRRQLAELAATCGFRHRCIWTDERSWFSVQLFEVV